MEKAKALKRVVLLGSALENPGKALNFKIFQKPSSPPNVFQISAMDASTLKLVIEKGPREGETLEFTSKPRFTIRIGRVVRGNTIAIKEDGVSTKHLTIEWSSQGKWIVKDLDSSNGTFLNSSSLPALTAHDLSNGDVLKFGEVTSIRVRISHFSDSQPVGRSLRSRTRVVGTGNSDDSESVAEGGNRRGRGRGRGGNVNSGDEGLGMEVPDSVVSVDPEVNRKGRGRGRGRTRGKGNATIGDKGLEVSAAEVNVESNAPRGGTKNSDDSQKIAGGGNQRGRGLGKGDIDSGNEGLGMEVPDPVVSIDAEVNVKGRGPGRGRTRGKGKATIGDEGLGLEVSDSVVSVNSEVNVESNVQGGGDHGKKVGNMEDETELNPENSENAVSITRKGGAVSKRRTRSSKNDNVGGSVEKVEPVSSLRRSTRSRGTKNKDNSAFTSALERIPEASQLVGSVNCEGIPEATQLVGLCMDSAQSVSVEDKGSEEEVIEGEQILRESMDDAVEGEERLAGGLDLVIIKSEPQSNAGGIVSKEESVREIVQTDGDLACKLNFVHEIGEDLEDTLDQNEDEEPESNIGGNVFQESTADATEKEAEAEIAPDLNKMTLGEWFDHLERCLPKQIRAETDQIAQDMLKRSQQFHEFLLQKQKNK